MSELVPSRSPFDRIKRTDERGDYWTARDLMIAMAYTNWRQFKEVLARAMAAAANVGADVPVIFEDILKNAGQVGRTGGDYRLTRYASYLTAQNGDPRKLEVAAAQSYFAIRTYEAERAEEVAGIAEGEELDLLEQQTERTQQAIAIARAERRRAEHFECRATQAEGTIREIEGGDGLTLRAFHKKYFSEVTERRFFEHLYAKKYLIDQLGKGSIRADGTRRNGSQHLHPAAKGKPFIYLHFGGVYGDKRREGPRVRPGQPELDFKAALVRDGLAANDHRTGYLFALEGGE